MRQGISEGSGDNGKIYKKCSKKMIIKQKVNESWARRSKFASFDEMCSPKLNWVSMEETKHGWATYFLPIKITWLK